MKNIKLKSLLNEGNSMKNAKDIRAGDVFIKNIGFGLATLVAMSSVQQSKMYKNEWTIYSTILVPGKSGKSSINVKGKEIYVTFAPKYGRFSNVKYIGKWKDVKDEYDD